MPPHAWLALALHAPPPVASWQLPLTYAQQPMVPHINSSKARAPHASVPFAQHASLPPLPTEEDAEHRPLVLSQSQQPTLAQAVWSCGATLA